jgi:hypothetical protein
MGLSSIRYLACLQCILHSHSETAICDASIGFVVINRTEDRPQRGRR